MKKQMQKGFTLIELMIVVAIIGILAAIAIPAYQDYIARSQASEASSILGGFKTPMSEYWGNEGAIPTTVSDITANPVTTGKYVTETNVTTADYGGTANNEIVFTATFASSGVSKKLQTKTVAMAYNTSLGTFSFSCVKIDDNVKPSSCK